MKPQTDERSRICLEFDEGGLTVLGNREALMDLRAQLDWLLEGAPEDHRHCHVLWSLENSESRHDGKQPRNAGLIISDGFQSIAEKEDPFGQVADLTFVHASDQTLDDKQKRQR
jgi:hypothetical protein